MNPYYEKLKEFRSLLIPQIEQLFDWYGNKLMLRLEDYNLLRRPCNCIESSTAIGFILEEFIVSKLEEFTASGKSKGYTLHSYTAGTSKRSSDCYALFKDLKILINLKVEKDGATNAGIAAVSQLTKDYCSNYEEVGSIAYLILKIGYVFSDEDLYRRIYINKEPEIIYLEEYDYSQGHSQDGRSWSESSASNNGRLQLGKEFMRQHPMPEQFISCELTNKQLLRLNSLEGVEDDYIMPADCCPRDVVSARE